jgi:hypothetical protein
LFLRLLGAVNSILEKLKIKKDPPCGRSSQRGLCRYISFEKRNLMLFSVCRSRHRRRRLRDCRCRRHDTHHRRRRRRCRRATKTTGTCRRRRTAATAMTTAAAAKPRFDFRGIGFCNLKNTAFCFFAIEASIAAVASASVVI